MLVCCGGTGDGSEGRGGRSGSSGATLTLGNLCLRLCLVRFALKKLRDDELPNSLVGIDRHDRSGKTGIVEVAQKMSLVGGLIAAERQRAVNVVENKTLIKEHHIRPDVGSSLLETVRIRDNTTTVEEAGSAGWLANIEIDVLPFQKPGDEDNEWEKDGYHEGADGK